MLTSLQIENVAVIQKADVRFEKGLNVLTGETGAGKSILIDSINAILGSRTSRELVRAGAAKAVIRAAFDQVPPAVQDSLEKAGYERSDELLLTREISAEGKSSCRINGLPATAALLRELCGGLVNINGQHDSVGLLNPARHEGILDDYARNGEEYQRYYALYKELIRVKRELDSLVTDEEEKRRRTELLQYQVQEIEDAALTPGDGAVDQAVFDEQKEKFRKALGNDLNTSLAVTALYDALKVKANDETKLALLADFDRVLSLDLLAKAAEKREADAKAKASAASGGIVITGEGDPAVDALVLQRAQAKKAKNFAEADRIRDALKAMGIEVTDTKEGASWRRV